MARKTKHRPPPRLTLDDVKARAERAIREGRYQQALDLVKQVYKEAPTPAHEDLLRKTYLGRARQLRGQGYTRDAATVLQVAAMLNGHDPAWMEQLAEELASCGEVQHALDLVARVPESAARERVLGQAADAALQQEAAGRKLLPESLHADFERILKAFADVEAGHDDQAREILQNIGLHSPFMEWKVFLRGLQAYHQRDDSRALENWQRLRPERFPARLAAPLRFLIDAGFRQAQPPAAQALLQKQADRLQGSELVPQLRAIHAAIAGEGSLARPFRMAEALLPALRNLDSQLVSRLAAAFYWTIVSAGQPEDLPRYRRVFGQPPDDPTFDRLEALALEHLHDQQSAHKHWQEFEKVVAANTAAWPAEQAARVRALVWYHMGENAACVPDLDRMPNLPPFLRNHPDRPRPLVPSAEACYRRSLELAPDQLETYAALFAYYEEKEETGKAIKAARQLLQRFPDHVPTLEALGDLYLEEKKFADGLRQFQAALKVNPLDRELRSRLSLAHTLCARAHAEGGRFDEARAEYQASLALGNVTDSGPVLCKWAASEFKAGNAARAEELLTEAHSHASNPLAIAYNMLIETIRLKLPRTLKNRFDRDFDAALAAPPEATAAVAIAITAASHHAAGIKYTGQKTHEKKVLAYLERVLRADPSESQMERITQALVSLQARKVLASYAKSGQRRFPMSPFFYLAEVQDYLARGPASCPVWQVRPLLEKARKLAEKLPPDERQKQVLEVIGHCEQLTASLNPFFGEGMMDAFEALFDVDEFDDDDDAP